MAMTPPPESVRQSLRHRWARQIDPELQDGPGLSRFNQVVVAAIVLLVTLGVIETEAKVLDSYGPAMTLTKAALFAFFAVEYGLRLWVASVNPRHGSAWACARTPSAVLDLVVLVTLALPFAGVEGTVLRLVQMVRLLRLARLGRFSRALNLLGSAIRLRGVELAMSAGLGFGVMLVAATLLHLAEGAVQPEAFGSIPRAMWWAVATLTTVGYGDVVPITAPGRVMAGVTALCGIGIIALPTGVLAGAFADALKQAREDGESRLDS